VESYLESNQINRTGSIITTTYDILGNNMLDIEILVPIDKVINLPLEYKMKPVFKITNAVYARHKGNPALLQGVYSEILEYIHNYGLQQITTAYNVTINEISLEGNVDELIIDVYIGVSNNIL